MRKSFSRSLQLAQLCQRQQQLLPTNYVFGFYCGCAMAKVEILCFQQHEFFKYVLLLVGEAVQCTLIHFNSRSTNIICFVRRKAQQFNYLTNLIIFEMNHLSGLLLKRIPTFILETL